MHFLTTKTKYGDKKSCSVIKTKPDFPTFISYRPLVKKKKKFDKMKLSALAVN